MILFIEVGAGANPPVPNMKNEYLTIREAMQTLCISKPTLYRYIKSGKLQAVKRINKTLICAASANELNKITPIN